MFLHPYIVAQENKDRIEFQRLKHHLNIIEVNTLEYPISLQTTGKMETNQLYSYDVELT